MAQPDKPDTGSLTCLGRAVILFFIIASAGGAYYFLAMRDKPASGNGSSGTSSSSSSSGGTNTSNNGPTVQIGIAYGTEKKEWLTWAVEQFEQAPDGKNIKVNLIPMGSLEGAQALLAGNEKINVWSPASAIYKDTFLQDWEIKRGGNPILKEENLALTPMVFVMWEERYQAFIKKYKTLNFRTIGDALQEKGGWDTIAQKPEWGLFKFGHTHPNQSNSGLATLLLMTHEYYSKPRQVDLKDVVNAEFQTWLQTLEHGVSGLSNSTGTMMKEMVLKGPSSFDVLFVYENVAIEHLNNAQGRWGSLRVIYPAQNMWNDNPYYIINAPWSSPAQREAAEVFLKFLLKEPIQRQALVNGFRPANLSVPIKGDNSPFTLGQKFGISIDLTTIVEPPKAEVITNLLTSWQRSQAGR
jgi:ABC-type Fe3+ transport system substrate-binding protein